MSQEQVELSSVSASKPRTRTTYSAEFRQETVCAYLKSGMGFVAFCKKEGLPLSTVQYWVENFEKAHPAIATTDMTKEERTRALEVENARLKRELVIATKERKKAEARAHAWETMIDVAEEMLSISIRKKADTKQ